MSAPPADRLVPGAQFTAGRIQAPWGAPGTIPNVCTVTSVGRKGYVRYTDACGVHRTSHADTIVHVAAVLGWILP